LMVSLDGEHEIVIEKSRFICHVKRVYTDDEAMSFIKEIKKTHWNATHNCSAYVVGDFSEAQKANDDGEPSGTAGVPMLEVLRKQNLKNCVVVVTRYFGGIKLGAGGLIRAYGKSVSEAIKELGLIERKTMKTMFINADYSLLGTIQSRLENSDYILNQVHYTDAISVEVSIDVSSEDEFTEWVTDMTCGRATIIPGEVTYREIPYVRES
ncbi:MAG: YigZ family protein, partial [Turicibacter sp.]